MRFAPTLIAAILSALIVLPAQATPAAPTEAQAPATTHAKAKAPAKAKATPKRRHEPTPAKHHATKKPEPVAKANAKPGIDATPQADAVSTPAQLATPSAKTATDITPQTQAAAQIDPQLMAKALALAKAQAAAPQDAPGNGQADTPAAQQTSLLDRAGASFQQVGASLQSTLDDALGLIGIRYRRGGTTPESGFDCSGFVVHVFREGMGLILPRTSRELSKVGEIVKKQDLQPGDLVFFNTMRRTFSHVGIYLGNGQFIHAPRTGSEVRIEDMRESYWVKRYEGARRMEVDE